MFSLLVVNNYSNYLRISNYPKELSLFLLCGKSRQKYNFFSICANIWTKKYVFSQNRADYRFLLLSVDRFMNGVGSKLDTEFGEYLTVDRSEHHGGVYLAAT